MNRSPPGGWMWLFDAMMADCGAASMRNRKGKGVRFDRSHQMQARPPAVVHMSPAEDCERLPAEPTAQCPQVCQAVRLRLLGAVSFFHVLDVASQTLVFVSH